MRSRGTCQKVAGALQLTSRVDAKPESAGSVNVININIKISNETLTSNPENILLRALKLSDSKAGEPETRPTHRLRSSRFYFSFRTISGVKLVLFQGEVLHACTPRPRRGNLRHPCFVWFIIIFNVCISPLLILYHLVGTVPYSAL